MSTTRRGPASPKTRGGRRLDQALVDEGLVDSRAAAQRLILAGEVRVDGEVAAKASQLVGAGQRLEIVGGPPYVSRGGVKLAAGLAAFGVSVEGKTCADVGASTGGFTDCLLQNGAARVFAIDVGHGVLHWKLRQDPRVVVLERTNARYLRDLPEPVRLVTIDVSFISLRHILPMAARWLTGEGDVVALVKPQFEAGRSSVGKGGIVRDPDVHRRVLEDVVRFAAEAGLGARGLLRSPLRGPKGNVEFLLWAAAGAEAGPIAADMERALAD